MFVFVIELLLLVTPHAQRERGKVIGYGVHIYNMFICLWTKKIFESNFRDRLTFSNIRSSTSHRIYRLKSVRVHLAPGSKGRSFPLEYS